MSNQKHIPNILILSLIQDLKCLDEIVDNTLDEVERMNIGSWLHPHKKFNTKLQHKISYEYQQLSYVNLLEMLIDRLYIILDVASKKMDIAENRVNIYHPQKVTLGRCVQKFWQLFSHKEEGLRSKIPNNSSETNFVINKGIQTESENSGYCDSCAQASEFMKDITEYIATNSENSLTKGQRDNINNNIFNMTMFGTTVKLTNSLKQDYYNLTEEMKNSKLEIQTLAKTISDLESNVNNKEKKISQCTAAQHQSYEEVAKNLVELIFAESYIISLEKEKTDLQRGNNNYKFITTDLGNQVKTLQEKQQNTKKHYEFQMDDYEKVLHTQKCKITSLKSDFDDLKSKYDYLYGKNSKMCQIYFKLEKNLDTIVDTISDENNITDNISKFETRTTIRITELNEKIKLLQENVHQQTNYIDKICIMQKVLIDSSKKMENKKFGNEYETSGIQGNPIVDITKQIEENDIKIDDLKLQNHKFRMIIQAIQNKT